MFYYVFLEENLLGFILFHFAYEAGQKLFTGPNVFFAVKPHKREIKHGIAQSSRSLKQLNSINLPFLRLCIQYSVVSVLASQYKYFPVTYAFQAQGEVFVVSFYARNVVY